MGRGRRRFALPVLFALLVASSRWGAEAANSSGRSAADSDAAAEDVTVPDGPGELGDGIPEPGTVHYDPDRVEMVSWAPRAYVYHGFMSKAECEHFMNTAKPQMAKSTVVDGSTGRSVPSEIRTSSGTFFRVGQDPVIEDVERRIAEFTMIPQENGEGIQILRYEHGQKYEAHFDYFHDRFNARPETGGNRLATLLMYLTDVEEGGETVFPNSQKPAGDTGGLSQCAMRGVAVKPRQGDALLFFSMDLKQQLDMASLHAGCPVIKGEKWSATKWMHVGEFQMEAKKRRRTADKCADEHDSCKQWAESGECERNPAYMIGSDGSSGECLKSCGKCK